MSEEYGANGLRKVTEGDLLRDAAMGVPNANVEAVEAALEARVSREGATIGTRKEGSAVGSRSLAQGTDVEASGQESSAQGYGARACSKGAHAEGYETSAGADASLISPSWGAHAEGYKTQADGAGGHAEGFETRARNGHAEGVKTLATYEGAHAEGTHTEARGYAAHAEGYKTSARARCAHAGGTGTVAASDDQTAIGRYNVEDAEGKLALIVGNGTSEDDRSNAATLDWEGNAELAGGLSAGGEVTDGAGNALSGKADASHSHDAGDIASGVLPRARGGTGTASFGEVVTVDAGEPVSLATSTGATVATVGLEAGTWLVICSAHFASNATGYRELGFGTGANVLASRTQGMRVQAASGNPTVLRCEHVLTVSKEGTYYLNCRQNSGSALDCTGVVKAVRLR